MHSITNKGISFKSNLINHLSRLAQVVLHNSKLKESTYKTFIDISKKTIAEMYNSFYEVLNTIAKDLFLFLQIETKYNLIIFQKTKQ